MAETLENVGTHRQRRNDSRGPGHQVSAFVVDASVVVKWFVPEVHSDAARRLLTLSHGFFAPDLLFAETANTMWKKIRRGELTAERGRQLVDDISRIAVETVPCRVLALDAHELANATGRTVHDSLYLALAIRLKTRMVTADDRLVAAVAVFPMAAAHIRLVQTFES
jgi:predicted nucleic acid-binding protein